MNNINYINIIKKTPQIRVHNEILGELISHTEKSGFCDGQITTKINNKYNKTLGSEIFSNFKESEKIEGILIEVEDEYRRKKYNIGELLRLSSIMMMLENNFKQLEIFSKNTAVYFHSKYKFIPVIRNKDDIIKNLVSIIDNTERFPIKDFELRAKNLLNQILKNKNNQDKTEINTNTSKFVNEYIQEVLKDKNNYKNHPFKYSLEMVLTKDVIIENKEFFNDLFAKHKINYRI